MPYCNIHQRLYQKRIYMTYDVTLAIKLGDRTRLLAQTQVAKWYLRDINQSPNDAHAILTNSNVMNSAIVLFGMVYGYPVKRFM